MKLKNETGIRTLFDTLLAAPLSNRPEIYESLAVLVADLRQNLDAVSNRTYILGKSGIFIETCKAIAGLDEHNVSEPSSIEYAKGNFDVMVAMVQWN